MQQERAKPTLKRTKFACVNCKAAKAACDSNRPCAWCIRHALQDSCVDAPRKTRTSKKICCDPSLHKNVVFKQEYKGFQLALAADFTPSTAVPIEPPMSPPADIFPIEDYLAPGSFDFGYNTSNNQPCSNCPLYQTCAKDAPQRLICATSASPPQSPLSPEHIQLNEDEGSAQVSFTPPPPMSLSSHPDYCLKPATPPVAEVKLESPQQPASPSTQQATPQQATPQHISPPQYLQSPQTPQSQKQYLSQSLPQISSQSLVVAPSALQQRQGCCGTAFSAHLPPLLDDVCNCQSLVQREMAKINVSLETISALMQLQNVSLLPTATFQLPDTTLEDCNDEFAKALGYEGRDDLMSAAAVDALAASTKEMMKPDKEAKDSDKPVASPPPPSKTKDKPTLTLFVPERSVGGLLKCANDMMRASTPVINQILLASKRGDVKIFTALIKPCGWFSYISLLKQHPQQIDGMRMCGE